MPGIFLIGTKTFLHLFYVKSLGSKKTEMLLKVPLVLAILCATISTANGRLMSLHWASPHNFLSKKVFILFVYSSHGSLVERHVLYEGTYGKKRLKQFTLRLMLFIGLVV